MLQCSMPTQCDQPAFANICPRVTRAAHRLGVADPLTGAMGELFQSTFTRPARDPAYRTNQLQPGALPLEWSFSEGEPDALRIELQPFDPEVRSQDRLQYTIEELFSLVTLYYGKELATQFEKTVKGGVIAPLERMKFGAFLGLVLKPNVTPQFKIYVELDPESRSGPWGVVSSITDVVPRFRSVAIGECGIAERFYYLCTEGFRLLDLEAPCKALGMSHRFPGLLMTLLDLTEGEFYLSPRSALLGIRTGSQGPELKIELVSTLAMSPDGLKERIERLLRPDSFTPFRRWSGVVCPRLSSALPISVVSVKISTDKPARLSLYVAEPWSGL